MKKKVIKIICLALIALIPLKKTFAYSFEDPEINEQTKSILEEVSLTWPSGMDEGRIQVIIEAAKLIGKNIPYSWGGGHGGGCPQGKPSGLDCSGYVSLAFHRGGVNDVACGWTTASFNTSTVFSQVSESSLVPGDIGLNNSSQSANNHVGIYIGKQNGQNIWFHSSTTSAGSGPQVRHGNGYFTYFLRYKNWNEVNISSGSIAYEGIGGKLGGSLEDNYYYFGAISKGDFSCENLFYYQHEDGQVTEKQLKKLLDGIFMLIKIITPVLAIALTIVDYIKALFKSDAKETKKVHQKTIKRIGIAILILMLPYLLEFLFKLFGLYDLNCGIS